MIAAAGLLVLVLVPSWTPDDWAGEYFVEESGETVAVAMVELDPVIDCDALSITVSTEVWKSPVGEDGYPTGEWVSSVESVADSVTVSDGPVRDPEAMCPMWHLAEDGSLWRDDVVPAPEPSVVPSVEPVGPELKVGLFVGPKVMS